MNEMIGHEREINWLQAAMKQKRLAHAYLFTDNNQVKTKQLAIQLAKTINCEQGDTDACDTCTTCVQIEHGNHPDVLTIQPDGAYIKIDQVRNMQETFRYRAPDHITRVLIIESADRMRVETANSLLKFLEEPISPMVAILLTDKKERILPTIQSRCQWVRFSSLPAHIQQQKFIDDGFDQTTAHLLSQMQYRDELLQLESQEIEQIFQNLITWSKALLTGDESALLDVQVGWIANELEQGRIHSLIEILLIWLKEWMKKEIAIFTEHRSLRMRVKEENVMLAIDNALIASRLLHKMEISNQAVWEQMVIATQEMRKSKQDDWHMIIM
ncbi:hypothetical protein [Shimazuella kribbensis]|uniref:hypothetical protein n=1 Tax=Shimazuella kribbensis TaxID=139808 RepID=UPI001FDEEAD7|nr:hypothetical protein [Shimazuella kribbensis]